MTDTRFQNQAASSARHSIAGDLTAWIDHQIRGLYPGCFALVMATGIISNALFFEGHDVWSNALFAVNVVAYPWLALLTIARLVRHRQAIWADLVNPRLVFAFFTIVVLQVTLAAAVGWRLWRG